jgi:hypothetical protein
MEPLKELPKSPGIAKESKIEKPELQPSVPCQRQAGVIGREHVMQVPEGVRRRELMAMESAERGQLVPMVLLELFVAVARFLVQIGERHFALVLRMRQSRDRGMIRPMDLMLVFGEVGADEDVVGIEFNIAASKQPGMPRHVVDQMIFKPNGFWTDK